MKLWKNMNATSKWAFGIFAALVLWFASGLVFKSAPKVPGAEMDAAANTEVSGTVALPSVAVEAVAPQEYARVLVLNGSSEALVRATVSAQTAGRVNGVRVVRGDRVTKGQILVTLDPANRGSDVRAAQAELEKANQLAASARELAEAGYFSSTQLAEREAQLASAKEMLARASQDMAYTQVKAPVDGIVEDTPVVVGDFVSVGTPVARVVQRDEILIVAYAGQAQLGDVPVGASATVVLANGETVPAVVRFVATDADPATRTYRVEAVVDGEAHPIPTGMTAALRVPLDAHPAYRVSHSALVLGDTGEVALMQAVADVSSSNSGRVARLLPVRILSDDGAGVWLAPAADTETAPDLGTLQVVVRGQAGMGDGAALPPEAGQQGLQQQEGGNDGD